MTTPPWIHSVNGAPHFIFEIAKMEGHKWEVVFRIIPFCTTLSFFLFFLLSFHRIGIG